MVLTTDAGLKPGDIPARGQEVLRNGVKVYYFPQVPGYGIKSPQLEQAVSDRVGEFDLVHVTAIWQRTGPAACRAARAAAVPYVISPRGALGPYSWSRGTVKKLAYYFIHERRNLQEASGFHYTSAMEAAECERFRFGKPTCIVPNAIDLDFWQRDATAGKTWRDKLGVTDDETVLLYAGRLHHKKGLNLLPEVLRQCQVAGLSVRLVFVGPEEDDTGHRLRAQFARLGIDKRVTFLPMMKSEALKAAYSGADIFVLPSLHENFGNVAVEASACGCHILASTHTGVTQELSALGIGKTLPLISSEWSNAIAETIARRQTSLEQWANLGSTFSPDDTADKMGAFYWQLSVRACFNI